MMKKKQSNEGKLGISDRVLYDIIRQVTGEVSGVYGLAKRESGGIIPKELPPISLSFGGDTVAVDICVLLKYGYRIQKVAEEIQSSVKAAIQDMSGVAVSKVNVYVSGIVFSEK